MFKGAIFRLSSSVRARWQGCIGDGRKYALLYTALGVLITFVTGVFYQRAARRHPGGSPPCGTKVPTGGRRT